MFLCSAALKGQSGASMMGARPKHAAGEGSGSTTHLEGVVLELLLPVDEQRAVLNLHVVPVDGDDSLDQRLEE